MRLKELIFRVFDGKSKNLAAASGISEGSISEYTRGKSKPSLDQLIRIAEQTKANPNWLLTGEGPMFRDGNGGQVSENSEVIYIPRLEVEASAGEGTVVHGEELREKRPFHRSEIRGLHANPENLTIIEVRGVSMQPAFNPGEEVMVDLTWPQSLVDGFWAVRINDTLMLKHIQQLPGNKLVVRSENPVYEPFTVDLERAESDGHFQIVGRVVWGAKRY